MMDKISDVTRQDIIDVIRNGFVVSFDEPQYDSISGNYIVSYRAKISYHGRLDEFGFLEICPRMIVAILMRMET